MPVGSFAATAFGSGCRDDRRYASDVRISRWSCFTDHFRSTNSAASQSSSSGCVGFLPVAPKLFGLPASGVPIVHCQTRFAMTRAVSGFFGSAIHSASAFRRPSIVAGIGGVARGAEHARASPSPSG